jgi:hypothetical protein
MSNIHEVIGLEKDFVILGLEKETAEIRAVLEFFDKETTQEIQRGSLNY